jgi:RHS repeat-associated protein
MRVGVAMLLGLCLTPTVAHAQAQDTVRYYHTDAIGSVRAITNETGQVVARYDFLPFGEEFPPSPDTHVPLQFAGKERDYATGFDYLGARYYANQTGRFMRVDPGHVGGDIFNPQSWNAYAYALNNPLRFIDPLGTCSQDAQGNYVDGDEAGTLVTPGPCPRGKDGALAIGVTETVSVRSKPAIVALAEGIAPWAPVVNGIAIGTGVVVSGGTGLAALGGASGSGALTLGLEGYVPFSLTATYATGVANYQAVIREVEALAASTAGRAQLTPQQIRALLQNVQDVINRTVPRGNVDSLRSQASLARWQFLNQLPAEAQAALRDAMAKHGIRIP